MQLKYSAGSLLEPPPAKGGRGANLAHWLYFLKRVEQSAQLIGKPPLWFWQRGLYFIGSNSEPAL